MDEILTTAQIETQFESEWVLVQDPQTDQGLTVRRGNVRWHSKDRDEVYRKAVELRLARFAIVYTGKIPKDTAVVLSSLRGKALRLPLFGRVADRHAVIDPHERRAEQSRLGERALEHALGRVAAHV